MDDTPPITYSRDELLSHLPLGWRLGERGTEGTWDDRRRVWKLTVRDGAEMDWEVAVRADRVASSGRLDALKEAMHRLYRDALG